MPTELETLLEDLYECRRRFRKKEAKALVVKEEGLERYIDLRDEMDHQIQNLEIAQLSDIAAKLESLESDLKAGIKRLKKATEDLETARKVVNAVTTVLSLVARVVSYMA